MIASFELTAAWDVSNDNLMWTAKATRDDLPVLVYCCRCIDVSRGEFITTANFFRLLRDMADDIGRYTEGGK